MKPGCSAIPSRSGGASTRRRSSLPTKLRALHAGANRCGSRFRSCPPFTFPEALAPAFFAGIRAPLPSGDHGAARKSAEEGPTPDPRRRPHRHRGGSDLQRCCSAGLGLSGGCRSDAPARDGRSGSSAGSAAVSTAPPLNELERQGIKGRVWLKQARAETERCFFLSTFRSRLGQSHLACASGPRGLSGRD